jgi:hypothetical protein
MVIVVQEEQGQEKNAHQRQCGVVSVITPEREKEIKTGQFSNSEEPLRKNES